MTMITMQTHCRTAVLQTGTSLVMASFQSTIPFGFWARNKCATSLMSRAIHHKEPQRLSCTFKNYQSVGGYLMSDPKGFTRNMDSL